VEGFCVRSARVSTRSSQKEEVKQDLEGGLLFRFAAESQTKAAIALVQQAEASKETWFACVCNGRDPRDLEHS
jgi:hypothetical protein